MSTAPTKRRGRPPTGKRPRLLLTIPPELDVVLEELADAFDIPKASIFERHAVFALLAGLTSFADWAKEEVVTRDNEELWARARGALLHPGPESLDDSLRALAPGWLPSALRTMPRSTPRSLSRADMQDLLTMLDEWRTSKKEGGT